VLRNPNAEYLFPKRPKRFIRTGPNIRGRKNIKRAKKRANKKASLMPVAAIITRF